VLFCTYPPKNFQELQKLRWIQLASTGYTQLSGLDLVSKQVRATNARGCFDVPIAEWVVAMMVNLVRSLRQMIRNQEHAVWDRAAVFQRELRGMTLGLWGYGGIGRETARLARAMGLRVHVLTRSGKVGPRHDAYTVPGTGDPDGSLPDRVFGPGESEAFCTELDFLVMALPLTKTSEGIVGERELRSLRTSAFVLNPSRGPIIEQDALLRALRERWIAGAALDTHYAYPLPPDHPLWRMENVILTPHISGSSLSPRFLERLWAIFGINAMRFHRNEPLLNELSFDDLANA
jgi:phosphoglycerate dehydrogenase-like enzyme